MIPYKILTHLPNVVFLLDCLLLDTILNSHLQTHQIYTHQIHVPNKINNEKQHHKFSLTLLRKHEYIKLNLLC